MSHGSSDDEEGSVQEEGGGHDDVVVAAATTCGDMDEQDFAMVLSSSTRAITSEQQPTQFEQAHQDAVDDAATTITSDEVPSMTDYTPMYSSVTPATALAAAAAAAAIATTTVEPRQQQQQQATIEIDDPADALLMDLHLLDPLEDFGWVVPKPTSQQEDETTLQALKADAALEQMLHHAMDDFGI